MSTLPNQLQRVARTMIVQWIFGEFFGHAAICQTIDASQVSTTCKWRDSKLNLCGRNFLYWNVHLTEYFCVCFSSHLLKHCRSCDSLSSESLNIEILAKVSSCFVALLLAGAWITLSTPFIRSSNSVWFVEKISTKLKN